MYWRTKTEFGSVKSLTCMAFPRQGSDRAVRGCPALMVVIVGIP